MSSPSPGPDPKKLMGKSKRDKEQAKKLKLYVIIGIVIGVLVIWFASAEMERDQRFKWVQNYERKCEACQTMIVSAIWTRSMIGQQEIKRTEQERLDAGLNDSLTIEQRNPNIPSRAVMQYMCADQQIDALLGNIPLTFGDGFTSSEDIDFVASVKKLCFEAMQNETTVKTFKKMLDTPMTQMSNPTLISVAKVHTSSVCAQRLGVCTEAQLSPGMAELPQGGGQGGPAQQTPQGVVEEASPVESLDARPDMAAGMPDVTETETEL
jgi:hypothetical protein